MKDFYFFIKTILFNLSNFMTVSMRHICVDKTEIHTPPYGHMIIYIYKNDCDISRWSLFWFLESLEIMISIQNKS